MALRTIPNNTRLSSIKKEEDDFTRSRLLVNPLTAALAVPFAQFISQIWHPVRLQEEALDFDLAVATAQVAYADTTLELLVKKVDSALLIVTRSDREAPLYVQFFGVQRPFEVWRDSLPRRLETVRNWLLLIAACSDPTLQALAVEVQDAVALASAALLAKLNAEKAILAFRLTGERAQLVDAYNALRKETYGALGKIKHEHPELPSDFADSFFRHEGNRGLDRLSLEQLEARIAALAAQQAALTNKREALLARQEAAATAKKEREQRKKQVALDLRKKQAEALTAAIARLEAEIESSRPGVAFVAAPRRVPAREPPAIAKAERDRAAAEEAPRRATAREPPAILDSR